MKKNKGVWGLIAAVVLVLGYAVLDYQLEKKEERTKTEQSKLLKISIDQISEIELVGSHSFHLKKEKDGWQFLTPIQELADQKSVEEFIDALASEVSQDTVAEGSVDWKIFGLDKPAASLALKLLDGSSIVYDISDTKNYQSESYVRIRGEEKVYLSSYTWRSRTDKKPFDFRDRRWLTQTTAGLEGFFLRNGKGEVELVKKEGAWTFAKHPEWKIDAVKWSGIQSIFDSSSVLEFIKEGDIKTRDLAEFGLSQASVKVKMKFPEKETLEISFAGQKAKSAAVEEDEHDHDHSHDHAPPRPTRDAFMLLPGKLVKVPSTELDKLEALSVDNLRDRREPFRFDRGLVKKMQIQLGSKDHVLSLKDGKWILEAKDSGLVADEEKAKDLLTKLESLEIAQFENRKDKKPSQKAVRLQAEDGSSVFEISFGEVFESKKNGKLVLASSSKYEDVFTIDEGRFKELALDQVIKKVETADPKQVMDGKK